MTIDALKIYDDLKAGRYDDVKRTEEELVAGTGAIVWALLHEKKPTPAAHEVAHLPAPVDIHHDQHHTGKPGLHTVGGHARKSGGKAHRSHKRTADSHHVHKHQAHHQTGLQAERDEIMRKAGF